MGNSSTTPLAPGEDLDDFDGIETLGYRVLGVQPDSPASKAGLVSFFDFLVGANGQMLLGSGEELEEGDEYDDVDFPALLLAHKGKPVELCKYCIVRTFLVLCTLALLCVMINSFLFIFIFHLLSCLKIK